MTEEQRYAEVIKALCDVALKSSGIRHEFSHAEDLRAFKSHPPGHDESYVSRTKYHDSSSDAFAFYVDQSLSRTCSIDTCRSEARYAECTAGTLTASHGKYDGAGFYGDNAFAAVHVSYASCIGYISNDGIELIFYPAVCQL